MPDLSFYRDQAERCLQLARVATDPKMAQDLRDLGQEFLAKAAESEAPEASDTSAARRPHVACRENVNSGISPAIGRGCNLLPPLSNDPLRGMRFGGPMPLRPAVEQLLKRCVAAKTDGADFPTIWNTILKGNRLVIGHPVQAMENGVPVLRIRLLNNQHLVYGRDGFSLG